MQHQKETYGNSHGESKADEQARMHGIAHARQGAMQEAPTEFSAPAETASEAANAVLSWGSGDHVVSAQPGDVPFTSELSRCAGVDGDSVPAIAPALNNVHQVPNCSEGQRSGVAAIIGYHENGGE